MSEIIPQQLHYTLIYLNHLIVDLDKTSLVELTPADITYQLSNALKYDGFDLEQYSSRESWGISSVFDFFGSFSHGRRLNSGNEMVTNLILVFVCVICAGFASGLTQGLLSLDYMEMKIKAQSGTPKEKEYANKVLPIISNHHLLLVTLMLWNASATEALPIFLDALVSEIYAIIISVTLVLMFGEIIPASILTGPKQLQIAANLVPMVWVVLAIFFPIAYPISKLLDYLIGHEEGVTMYSRLEIVTMMSMQHEEAVRRASSGHHMGDAVHKDDITIIGGALKYRDMKVSDVMTTFENIFMISAKECLSYKTLYKIFKAGYSRIPVYDQDANDIIGLILAKDLIFIDPEDDTPISNFVEFFGRKPVMVWHDQRLDITLQTFRKERAHLAMVRDVCYEGDGDPYYKVVGIITLEDIIEEILGAEIEDEFDLNDAEMAVWPLRDIDLARLKSLRSKVTDEKLSEDEVTAIVTYLPKNVPQIETWISKEGFSLRDVIMKSHVFLMKRETAEGEIAHPHSSDVIVRKGKFTNTCILILQGQVRIVYDASSTSAKEQQSSHTPMLAITDTPDASNNSSVPVVTTDTIDGMSSNTPLDAEQESLLQSKDGQRKARREDSLDSRHVTIELPHLQTSTSHHAAAGAERVEHIVGPWSTICVDALLADEGSYAPDFSAYIHSSDLRFLRISSLKTTIRSFGHGHGHHHGHGPHTSTSGHVASVPPLTSQKSISSNISPTTSGRNRAHSEHHISHKDSSK